MPESVETTQILIDLSNGERSAAERLMPLVVDELHALAVRFMDQERANHTLQATALVNEAYLKLIDQTRVDWKNRAHFFAIASQTIRRVLIDHARQHLAAKRGGGAVRGESAFADRQAPESHQPGLSQVTNGEPSPEFAAQFAEQFEQLLTLLADDTLRRIALAKMEGYTNAELARDLGLNVRSIERKLRLIRRTWQQEGIS